MKILKYGDDTLKKKAAPVKEINDEILQVIQDMKECLKNTPGGIGLAAPQIGISLQISVIDLSILDEFTKKDCYTLINPEIIEASGAILESEGCLSFPNITTVVKRFDRIKVTYLTEENEKITLDLNGYISRVFQHEIDHLNGVLIIDRVSSLKKQFLRREISKRKKLNEW